MNKFLVSALLCAGIVNTIHSMNEAFSDVVSDEQEKRIVQFLAQPDGSIFEPGMGEVLFTCNQTIDNAEITFCKRSIRKEFERLFANFANDEITFCYRNNNNLAGTVVQCFNADSRKLIFNMKLELCQNGQTKGFCDFCPINQRSQISWPTCSPESFLKTFETSMLFLVAAQKNDKALICAMLDNSTMRDHLTPEILSIPLAAFNIDVELMGKIYTVYSKKIVGLL